MKVIKPLPKKRSWDLAIKRNANGEIQKVDLADAPYRDPNGDTVVKDPRDPRNYWSRDVYFTNREKATEAGFEIVKPFVFEAALRPIHGWARGSCFEDVEMPGTLFMKEGDVHQLLHELVLGRAQVHEGVIVGRFTWTKYMDELTVLPYHD